MKGIDVEHRLLSGHGGLLGLSRVENNLVVSKVTFACRLLGHHS